MRLLVTCIPPTYRLVAWSLGRLIAWSLDRLIAWSQAQHRCGQSRTVSNSDTNAANATPSVMGALPPRPCISEKAISAVVVL